MAAYDARVDASMLDGRNGFSIFGLAAGDRLGASIGVVGDFDGDGCADLVLGAPSADPGGEQMAGSAYLVFGEPKFGGPVWGLASLDGGNGLRLDGSWPDEFTGLHVAPLGDINGDGRYDLGVGGADDGEAGIFDRWGNLCVVFGTDQGEEASLDLDDLDGANGFRLYGHADGDGAGSSFAPGGDLNGDGRPDLLVAAPTADRGGGAGGPLVADAGCVYAIWGKAEGEVWSASYDLQTIASGADGMRIEGISAGDRLGTVLVGPADVNGDGRADLLLAAPGADPGGEAEAGSVYVLLGPAGGFGASVNLSAIPAGQGFRIDGPGVGAGGGSAIAVGDLNGDGREEIAIGAPGSNSVHVLYGRADGWSSSYDLGALDASAGFTLIGDASALETGRSISVVGDWNGDGLADLLLGARGMASAAGPGPGLAYLVFGRVGGFGGGIDLGSLDGDDGFVIVGEGGDQLGVEVAAGDLNGDGLADIIVGAPGANNSAGAAYVIYGATPGEAVNRTGAEIGQAIWGGAFNDTVSGLGGNDTVKGGDGDDRLDGGKDDDVLIGGAGLNTLLGGKGMDRVDYSDASEAVTVDLAAGTASSGDRYDLLSGIEAVTGSMFDDSVWSIVGSTVSGWDGDDHLRGDGGASTLDGGNGNDTIEGGGGRDRLVGGEGDDRIYGAMASVLSALVTVDAAGTPGATIIGGGGSDTLVGTANDDRISDDGLGSNWLFGGVGNDTLTGGRQDDTLEGGADNDLINGNLGADMATYASAAGPVVVDLSITTAQNTVGAGTDTLKNIEHLAGSGFGDVLTGDSQKNRIYGGEGNDLIEGGLGADTLDGGEDTDWASFRNASGAVNANLATGSATGAGADLLADFENLFGSSFNDTLTGDAGNNVLHGGAGADTMSGNGGNDTASYELAAAGVKASLFLPGLNTGEAAGDIYASIENLTGSEFADDLEGSGSTLVLKGLDGNDSILAGVGANTVSGGNGNDRLNGYFGNDMVYGDAGDDTLHPGMGTDYLNGGSGSDTGTWEGFSFGVSKDLALTSNQGGDILVSIENARGTAQADTFYGTTGGNVLTGLGGADTLTGRGGADTLDGGGGLDHASYAGASAGVKASLVNPASNTGDAAGDIYIGIECLIGTAFHDILTGGAGLNALAGGAGSDWLEGGAGGDVLNGGADIDTAFYQTATAAVTASLAAPGTNLGDALGDTYYSIENLVGSTFADTLTGDAGSNTFIGSGGSDTITGGAGPDSFSYLSTADSSFALSDRILDFAAGDLINVMLVDADTTVGLDQAFHLDGTWGGAGDIRVFAYDSVNDRTAVYLYVDNNSSADMRIFLKGDHDDLTAADFVL